MVIKFCIYINSSVKISFIINIYSTMSKKSEDNNQIIVLPYDSEWPNIFKKEAAKIKEYLGFNCLEIHHIGSTSIPDLISKPVIDMIVVVENSLETISKIESLGYQYKGELNIPMRHYFSRSNGIKFHLHLYEKDHPEISLNLLFRNYLRIHSDAKNEYGLLKKKLSEEKSSSLKNNSMFSEYTLGKDKFIKKILKEAGFDELRMTKSTHYEEWEAIKKLRKKYFFDPIGIDDPYTWTFNHKEHIHLVLYLGIEIIGYAHIQFWPNQRVALRIFVIDEAYQNFGYGSKFLKLCEQWLKTQNIISIHDEARADSVNFYKKNGYEEMPFEDPTGEPPSIYDIAVGKILI